MANNRQDWGSGPTSGEERHWPDTVFKVALVVWLIGGLGGVLRALLRGTLGLTQVLLVAWGVIVILVLWVRLGRPTESGADDEVIR
jgi:hypothetical protein